MERTSAADVPIASLGQRSRTPNKWVASNRTSMSTLASPAQWVHQHLVESRKVSKQLVILASSVVIHSWNLISRSGNYCKSKTFVIPIGFAGNRDAYPIDD